MASTFCPECDALTHATSTKCPVCSTKRPVEGWPVDPLIGTVFADSYAVMKRLGRGGFGVVYLAENREFGGKRALKVLRREHVHSDRILHRFKREAKALYRLQSPYTVRMERWGRTDAGHYYMIMEFAEGETLRRILDIEGRLEEPRAVNIARQIAVALADAHALNILHRDLKPENIVVRSHVYEGDRIAVLDFGISKILSDETDSHVSGLVGTPAYMAPENYKPALGETDIRSDLWSLGVILYEMLVGRLPFGAGSTSDPIAIAYQATHLKPKEIQKELQRFSASDLTKQIAIRLLQPVPEHRYATPADLLALLDSHPVLGSRQGMERASEITPDLDFDSSAEMPSRLPPTALADTLPDATGVELGGSFEGASSPEDYDEGPSLFGDEPSENFIFQDEPPEDLKIRTRSVEQSRPDEAKPPHRLRTAIIAFAVLGIFALVARYSDRLLFGDGAPEETDMDLQEAGDLEPLDQTQSGLPPTLEGTDGMPLHLIEGGAFTMGADDIESARPGHEVMLSPFYLDEREVTADMWLRCVETGACPADQALSAADLPQCRLPVPDGAASERAMNCISWVGAQAYCRAMGRRLPTEAEWERAARGPANLVWPPWIDPSSESHRDPETDEDHSQFGPVDLGWGLQEWVSDWYAEGYYAASPASNPTGPFAGTQRVVRGGPSASGRPVPWVERGHRDPSSRLPTVGFRCAEEAAVP